VNWSCCAIRGIGIGIASSVLIMLGALVLLVLDVELTGADRAMMSAVMMMRALALEGVCCEGSLGSLWSGPVAPARSGWKASHCAAERLPALELAPAVDVDPVLRRILETIIGGARQRGAGLGAANAGWRNFAAGKNGAHGSPLQTRCSLRAVSVAKDRQRTQGKSA